MNEQGKDAERLAVQAQQEEIARHLLALQHEGTLSANDAAGIRDFAQSLPRRRANRSRKAGPDV